MGLTPTQVPTRLGAANADLRQHRERAHDPPPPHRWVPWGGTGTGEEGMLNPPPETPVPTGYLGALAVALFGALGARGEPLECWGAELLRVLPLAWDYVEGAGVAVGDNAATWPFFRDAWHR